MAGLRNFHGKEKPRFLPLTVFVHAMFAAQVRHQRDDCAVFSSRFVKSDLAVGSLGRHGVSSRRTSVAHLCKPLADARVLLGRSREGHLRKFSGGGRCCSSECASIGLDAFRMLELVRAQCRAVDPVFIFWGPWYVASWWCTRRQQLLPFGAGLPSGKALGFAP